MKPSAVVPLIVGLLLIALGTAVGVLFSSMEARLASSEGRLAELEAEIAGWAERLGGVGEAADRIAILERKHEDIGTRIADLEQAFGAVDGQMEGLGRDVRIVEESLASLKEDVLALVGEDAETLPQQLETVEAQLSVLSEQVQELSRRVAELEGDQEAEMTSLWNFWVR